eukprot:TRINITY_DN11349_c0_g1_i1.p1 TRINITY_DN11349_c0_g1~~TRINITY_DN11349_c0_g1_i1.p1  ORF type:complete len:58 (-),score=8.62 TRINITY_DN11349_c0_g1_i1:198-347(-)
MENRSILTFCKAGNQQCPRIKGVKLSKIIAEITCRYSRKSIEIASKFTD